MDANKEESAGGFDKLTTGTARATNKSIPINYSRWLGEGEEVEEVQLVGRLVEMGGVVKRTN